MNQEIIELLAGPYVVFFEHQGKKCVRIGRDDYKQALDILKQQPAVGEFTKKLRHERRENEMNKEELEQELVRARAAETTIKNKIIELLEQLVESEKPKLGHGDFGISCVRKPFFLVGTGKKATAYFQKEESENWGENSDEGNYCGAIKGGNVFDLLKEWSEDLGEFRVGCCDDKSEYHLKAELQNDGSYRIGTQTDTILISAGQVEEFWHKLGQMIATLKRKQS